MKIERFEIDSWGTVKLHAYKNGRSMTYEYNGVPKKFILKLLQAKTTPEINDFDNWIRDYRDKENTHNKSCAYGFDWWTKESD
jgi:hypothetical protein